MDSRRPRPRRRLAGRLPPPGDGALVRLSAARPEWWQGLPAAPPGCLLTLSLWGAGARPATGAAASLRRRGYLLVTPPSEQADQPGARQVTVDILVRQHVIDRHPEWWRALAGRADRCYNLASGPVQRALEVVLRAHAQALERHLRQPGAVSRRREV